MARYEGEEKRLGGWHLHVAVPLTLIGGFLFQGVGFIWNAAHVDAKINQTASQVEQLEKWRSKQDDQLAKIDALQAAEGQKIDDLSQTVHRMDDLLEQHFYRK